MRVVQERILQIQLEYEYGAYLHIPFHNAVENNSVALSL